MSIAEIEIINKLGLHARAAAQLVKLADTFGSEITLSTIDRSASANADSILSVLFLAAPQGTRLFVEANGSDEERALKAVVELFESGFGEVE